MPIRVSAVDDLLMQKLNGDQGVMVERTLVQHILLCLILIQVESLTEICKSSNNGNEDSDDTEFPPVPEIGPNYWKNSQLNET
jgi:hypothetical protein